MGGAGLLQQPSAERQDAPGSLSGEGGGIRDAATPFRELFSRSSNLRQRKSLFEAADGWRKDLACGGKPTTLPPGTQRSSLPVCCPLAGRSHGLIPTSTINH